MIIKQINNLSELQELILSEDAILLYFNTTSCSVGEAIFPKVESLITSSFPKIRMVTIDLNLSPEIAAYYTAFVEPTILVYFQGEETIRKSRNISVFELEETLNRLYKLIFE